MQSKVMGRAAAWLGLVSGVAILAQAPLALAQSDYGQQGDEAPPQGQYAEPPPGYDNGSTYDDQAQDYDNDYADRYSQWAAQNCVNERNNNAAAGAIIGGVLGAVAGSNLSGRHNRTGGAVVGGALGATAGASIGANSGGGGNCPPGYVIRGGAPAFAYGGPAYYAGPSWYNPWVFVGGRYVYHPYRYWYWNHRNYWRPGWHGRPFKYRHRRW